MIKMIRRQKTPSSQPLLYLSLPFNKKQLASSTKTPEDYLAELPPARDLDPSRLSSLIRAELLRVSEGRPMPPLDASRYRLDPPPPTAGGTPERGELASTTRARSSSTRGTGSSTSSSRCGSGRGLPRRTRRTPLPPPRC